MKGAKWRRRVQRLSVVLPRALGRNIELVGINLALRNNWDSVVRKDLCEFIKFDRAVLGQFGKLTVFAKTLGSMALLASAHKASMISAIKLLTGIDLVEVCFEQVHDVGS